jgi:surface antigen
MKKIAICVLASAITFGIAGCQPGNNVPGSTAVGAIAGGMLGSALFHGSGQWAGILGGAVLGGIVGNQIGQSMDRRDRMNMQSAIVNTPVGQEASWTNSKTHRSYVVRPVKSFRKKGRYCREFQTRIKVAGKWQQGYGRACRQPDGSWKINR